MYVVTFWSGGVEEVQTYVLNDTIGDDHDAIMEYILREDYSHVVNLDIGGTKDLEGVWESCGLTYPTILKIDAKIGSEEWL